MAVNTISMGDVKKLLNYTIDNNLKLQEAGKMPIAISLEATAGIGKTSIVEQVAKERGMTFAKVSLHELDETGDLLGFPQKEHECQMAKAVKDKDGNVKMQILPGTTWLNEKQLESKTAGAAYRQTGKTRMGYAKPAWVPEYNENGTLVVLDDYVRATPQLLQSSMELILTQKYTSWSLPKKTTIVLTNNPDDGQFNVSSLDEAQKSRFLNFDVEFSLDAWSKWAEETKVDGRCINFVLSYSNELFASDDQGNHICNPRSFVMFADMISGLKDWDNAENLAFISQLASGCFKDEGRRFSQMFTSFIRNKMHLLIQPKDILLGSWKSVRETLEKTVYDEDGHYRPDIASLLERRLANYIGVWLDSSDKTPIATVKDRIIDLLDYKSDDGSKTKIFTPDVFYHLIRTVTDSHRNQTNKLLFEPRIAAILTRHTA